MPRAAPSFLTLAFMLFGAGLHPASGWTPKPPLPSLAWNHPDQSKPGVRRFPEESRYPKKPSYIELGSGLPHNTGPGTHPRHKTGAPALRLVENGAEATTPAQRILLKSELSFENPSVEQWIGGVSPVSASPALLLYRDLATNQTVILSRAKTSRLTIKENNAVYPDAFDFLHADVRYTVGRHHLEQDILLYSKPPPPSAFGLNDDSTVFAVLTRLFHIENQVQSGGRFVDPVTGEVLVHSKKDLNGLATPATAGPILFTQNGRALQHFARSFFLPDGQKTGKRMPVRKRLVTIQGVHFLAEEIPAQAVLKTRLPDASKLLEASRQPRDFQSLSVQAKQNIPANKKERLAFARPPGRAPPVVIDYISVAGGTLVEDFVFESGKTYLISLPTVMTGLVTIEGGAVIKFDDAASGASLELLNPQFATRSSSWALFTSKHDDSVGEIITGSTGNPAPASYLNALTLGSGAVRFVQVRYAQEGIAFQGSGNFSIRDAEFFAVGTPVKVSADTLPSTVDLNNLLVAFGTNGPVLNDDGINPLTITANNMTFYSLDEAAFDTTLTAAGSSQQVTDSLFVDLRGTSVFSGTAPNVEDFNAFFQTPGTGTGTNNIVLASDPVLTDWFLDQTSPVIDAGSRSATDAGLYHYTTHPQKTVESTTPVDIGYHLPPEITSFSVFATNSVWIRQNAVVSGSVAVNDVPTSALLSSGGAMVVGIGATTPAGESLFADTIKVKSGAIVNSDVYHNGLINNGTITGSTFTPLSLPVFDALPLFRQAQLGTNLPDILVPLGGQQTITPGQYGELKVKKNGKLILAPGLYEVNNIDLGTSTQLAFQGPVEIRVADDLQADQNSIIGPDTGVTLNAGNIQFFIEKTDNGGTPRAAKFGIGSNVTGHYYAPNGTVWVRQNATATGIFLAKNVLMGIGSDVVLDPGGSLPRVATPTITPGGGTFFDQVTVSLSTITSGATIHFTTDGTNPTTASPVFTAPFTLTVSATPVTVKALAVRPDYLDSGIASAVFTVDPRPTVEAVTFSPDPSVTYQDTVDVTLATATPGASIFYTLDGTTPTTASIPFTGPFTLTAPATVTAFAVKTDFNDSAVTSAVFTVQTGPPLPPDPATVAPSLDQTLVADVGSNTAFLYTGTDPIQTGVAPGTIVAKQAAVVRGQVLNRDGTVLSGVTVTIHGHPEFGSTLSRADGFFDLVVNGGTQLIVDYQKDGFLPAQRKVHVPWQDIAVLDDVALIPLDPQVTLIDLNAATPVQVARGSVETDTDGSRQATLLFPQGTTAQMVLPDGTSQPLTTLSVRATEYTVGPNGPMAMPAKLPPTSAYTYAAEFSVDEALAAGAVSVDFSQPVPGYLENFLNWPVGEEVPSGFYDRVQGKWVPSQNGLVIKILSITGGLADLDTDGDGLVDSPTTLTALGITDNERTTLASLYTAGQSLWRVPVDHFSPFDWNAAFGFPADAVDPNNEVGQAVSPPDRCNICEAASGNGSSIQVEGQILGQAVPVVGTPFSMGYNSDRVRGSQDLSTLDIPLIGSNVPASLEQIDLTIDVAGRRFKTSHVPSANLSTEFAWDGLDVYGREVSGTVQAKIKINYLYPTAYKDAKWFGGPSRGITLSNNSRRRLFTSQEYTTAIKSGGIRSLGLGGWTLDILHFYDPFGKVLHRGDGTRRSTESLNQVAVTSAGGGSNLIGVPQPGDLATNFDLGNLDRLTSDSEGNIYFHSAGAIYKVTPDGIISKFAGTAGVGGFSGDGGSANNAVFSGPQGMTFDSEGNFYIADSNNHRIRKIDTNGIIQTIAGNGIGGFSGDEGPATAARLNFPKGVAVDGQGNVYIADTNNSRVRMVSTDGIIHTMAGPIGPPQDVVVDSQDNFYFSSNNGRVFKGGPDGSIKFFAGDGTGLFADGVPATQTGLAPEALAFGPDGNLYIASQDRVRVVGTDGIIHTVAGTGQQTFNGDGLPATSTNIDVFGITVDPDGNLYVIDRTPHRVRKVAALLPGFSTQDFLFPSEDGTELFVFDSTGRHLRTANTLTGATVFTFNYDTEGRLTSVVDGDGDTTTFQRDVDGNLTGITGPDGQLTSITLDPNGYIASITNPNNETTQLAYTADGLLNSVTDPRLNSSTYNYDARGRLTLGTDPANSSQTLAKTGTRNDYSVSNTTALGRSFDFSVENLLSGGKNRRVATGPDGLQTETLLDLDGSQTVTTPDGTVTVIGRTPDPRWGMKSPLTNVEVTTPGGLISNISLSRSTTLTDPDDPLSLSTQTDTLTLNGRTFTSVFDANLLKITDTTPENRTTAELVDSQGRVLNQQIPNLEDTVFGYDLRGRLTTITQGSGVNQRVGTIAYNPQGLISSITDPESRVVTFQYDLNGRVTKQILPDLREINLTYDPKGNVTSITPPGRPAHVFNHTSVDLESQYSPPLVTGPGTNATIFTYNLDKQLTQIARPDGQTVSVDYDTGGRLDNLVIPRGITSYAYDAITGNLASITTPDLGVLSFTYDGPFLLSSTWAGTVSGTVSQTYNNDFQTTSRSVNGANTISFGYDNDGLLTTAGAETLTYDPGNGLLTGTTVGVVTDSLTYNGFGEMSNYTASVNASPQYQSTFVRDKLGRITQKTETAQGVTHVFDYTYDTAGRLTEVKKDSVVTATYTYDSNGNRLNNGAVYDDQDRLLSQGSATYTYTANGELLTKTDASGTTTYNYDVLGNLISVTLPSGTTIEYLIDGRNRRIGKKVNGTLERAWLYKDGLNPIAELDGAGNVVSRFVYAGRTNIPDFMIRSGTTYRIISDHLGSPRLVVDTVTGAVAQRMDYDEWGNILADTNPGFQPFGFAGGIYDPDTKLVRFGSRDYDAEIGRWTVKDPIRFVGGDSNLFGYAFNDPVNFIDPLGWIEFTEEELDLLKFAATLPFIDGPLPVGDAGSVAITGIVIGKKGIQEVAAICLKTSGKKFIKGVYEFIADSGKKYYGQSKNVYNRLLQHIRGEKLEKVKIKTIKIYEVRGPKINRLRLEQKKIKKAGIANLDNKINALRENRKK